MKQHEWYLTQIPFDACRIQVYDSQGDAPARPFLTVRGDPSLLNVVPIASHGCSACSTQSTARFTASMNNGSADLSASLALLSDACVSCLNATATALNPGQPQRWQLPSNSSGFDQLGGMYEGIELMSRYWVRLDDTGIDLACSSRSAADVFVNLCMLWHRRDRCLVTKQMD